MFLESEDIIFKAEKKLSDRFEFIKDIAQYNQEKVLNAFKNCNVASRHFAGTSGYGYDDIGRDTLARVFSDIFQSESALVSPNLVSGTHALTVMLFGVLRPFDTLLSISGQPYDTLNDVLTGKNVGSLSDFSINFDKIDLVLNNEFKPIFDDKKIVKYLSEKTVKAVFIQRSRGYNLRQAISMEEVARIIKIVKEKSPQTLVLVDNCYGEFVEKTEPTEFGADAVAGSLIKNMGGGIIPTGGYIVGKSDVISQISYRLTSPSIGNEVGSYQYGYMPFYQGVFLAPVTVKNALKGALLFAEAFSSLGFEVLPKSSDIQHDIVTSIKFKTENQLIEFCRAIQHSSPIDSFLTLEPWDMPGYNHKVIMAAGTFVQGASIELSADAPIKEPYVAYFQGALTYEHAKIALKGALDCVQKYI